jgi:RNA polymerase sigma factor (TIGR02999 family)
MPETPNLSEVLEAIRSGNEAAVDDLFSIVYGELRSIAQAQRSRWDGNYTLNTTALVHEAYLKLTHAREMEWEDRAHFLRVASRAMRHILINYAERQRAAKRGGGATAVPLDQANPVAPEAADDLLALNAALERLAGRDERVFQVVECRFFGGLSVKETAKALGVSPSTVNRDWTVASAWLRRELEGDLDQGAQR